MKQCEYLECREGEDGKPKRFDPSLSRTPQRFCCNRCRMAWNYQQRKEATKQAERQDYAEAVEDAEARINGHVNGHSAAKPDLAALGLVSRPQETVRRRRI